MAVNVFKRSCWSFMEEKMGSSPKVRAMTSVRAAYRSGASLMAGCRIIGIKEMLIISAGEPLP
jgi:hypothetical protein